MCEGPRPIQILIHARNSLISRPWSFVAIEPLRILYIAGRRQQYSLGAAVRLSRAVFPILRSASVVLEQTTEALLAFDHSPTRARTPVYDLVSQALVIPFLVVVSHVGIDSSSQRTLSKQNQPVETFGLDRQNKAFRESVGLSRRMHPIRMLSNDIAG